MTRPILIAGLLGGLLGGVVSFTLSRTIKPVAPEKSEPEQLTQARAEARVVAEAFVAKLKAAKFEEFVADAKTGAGFTTDEEIAAFKKRLLESRALYSNTLGSSSGEFELLRETSLSPSLFRFVYLEKFEKGGIWWMFVLYRGKDSWKLVWADHGWNLANLFANLS